MSQASAAEQTSSSEEQRERCFVCSGRPVAGYFRCRQCYGNGKLYVCQQRCIDDRGRAVCPRGQHAVPVLVDLGTQVPANIPEEPEPADFDTDTIDHEPVTIPQRLATLELEVDRLRASSSPGRRAEPLPEPTPGAEPTARQPGPWTQPRDRRLCHPIRRRHLSNGWQLFEFDPQDEPNFKSKSRCPEGCQDLEMHGSVSWRSLPPCEPLPFPSHLLVNDEKKLLFTGSCKPSRHRLAKIVLGGLEVPWQCVYADHRSGDASTWASTKLGL